MKKFLISLWLCLSPALALSQGGTAVDDLLQALAGISQLQGKFIQRQYAEGDVLQSESSGNFRLLRPGYFAWEIEHPDSQLIIADPVYIWHHDRDLETVTRRPVSSGPQMTPLQILGGDEATLREAFTVVRGAQGRYTLTPLAGDVGFRQLTLQLDGARIIGMDILDNLDQRVLVEFSDLDSESELLWTDFAFAPPAGADFFSYDE